MKKPALLAVALAALLAGCAQKEEPPKVAAAPAEAAPAPAPARDPIAAVPDGFHVAAFRATPTSCTADSGRHWATVALQVEMMVTSLNCGAYYGNPNAYAEYRAMAGKSADVLADATRQVAATMGKGRDGMKRFDDEQTRLANAVALSAGGFNQAAFCEPRRAWFERMTKATREDLLNHSSVVAPALCARQQVALAEAEAARVAAAAAAAQAKADAKAAKKPATKNAAAKPAKAPAPAKKQVVAAN
jgi:hypothetical protein